LEFQQCLGSKKQGYCRSVKALTPAWRTFVTTKSVEIDKVARKATIADADIVVSEEEDLKGPENCGMS